MTTYAQQETGGPAPPGPESTWSREGSSVSRSPAPESNSASETNVGAGRGCETSSLWPDLDMSSSRMSPRCLGTLKLLAASSVTFPSSGSMQSGLLYQRAPWVPHTHVSACSYWPTPRAADAGRGGVLGRDRHYWNLADAARNRDGQGPVSPALMEWLMGFPAGFTDVRPSAMPSSPLSPS
jgi:hypothetical protein